MKKYIFILATILIFICGTSLLVACSKIGTPKIKSIGNATIDDRNLTAYMLVDKSINSLNLSNLVETTNDSIWELYSSQSELINTKVASLNDGENIFFIKVLALNNKFENTYTLTIYKSYEICINYFNVYNECINTEIAETGYQYDIDYIPQIDGYSFNFWLYEDNKVETIIPWNDINLYADCNARTYTISLNLNGGELENFPVQFQVEYDSLIDLPIPVRECYMFDCWMYGEEILSNGDKWKILNDCEIDAEYEFYLNLELKEDNTYKVLGGKDENMTKLIIPDSYENIPITEIDREAFRNNLKIEEIYFGENVKIIGHSAFYLCENLNKVTWAKNSKLEMISFVAFSNCVSLTSFTIPKNTQRICDAFTNCSNLEKVFFEDSADWSESYIPSGEHSYVSYQIDLTDPLENAAILKEEKLFEQSWQIINNNKI